MNKSLSLIFLFLISFSIVFGQNGNEKKSTASDNVSIIKKEFIIPNLNNISHKVWVYLPPYYNVMSKKYPVIYMHDAQNLFDDKTSYIGEWEVDEILNKLYHKTGNGYIVVAVENGGEERINEYTPWTHPKYGGGKGAVYIDFIVNTLKPYIDSNYRTKKQAKNTALIGSSLGGLISFYGGLKYPKKFGKIGALSTSFWFSDKVNEFTKEYGNLKKTQLFLLIGGKEGNGMVTDTRNMEELLLKTGFNSDNLSVKISPDGQHNEDFWNSEFLNVVTWLFKNNF